MTDEASKGTGPNEDRDGIFYLWHLHAIGLCDKDGLRYPHWPRPGISAPPPPRRARIAVIDNGTANNHPNLSENFLAGAIDYTSSPDGVEILKPSKDPKKLLTGLAGVPDKTRELIARLEERLRGFAEANEHKAERRKTDQTDAPGLSDEEIAMVREACVELSREADELEKRVASQLAAVAAGKPAHVDGTDHPEWSNFSRATSGGIVPPHSILNSSDRFAAHGTATVGLLCAGNEPEKVSENPFAIPYVGVNPTAEILSIVTPYSPDYWPLIKGLIYALTNGADVILMPRIVGEMDPDLIEDDDDDAEELAAMTASISGGTRRERRLRRQQMKDDRRDKRHKRWLRRTVFSPRWSRLVSERERYIQQQLFENLLCVVSNIVPVILPAGNTGEGRLSYPASIAVDKRHEGTHSLIVVGACSARGRRSAYSAGWGEDARGITVYAPSDDSQEVTTEMVQFDRMSWRGRRLFWQPDEIRRNTYSPYGVFSIDIAGEYGYASDADDSRDYAEVGASEESRRNSKSPEYKPRSLYTLFGGTSAASAIVAGVVSLKPGITGSEAKVALEHSRKPAENYEEIYGIPQYIPDEDLVEHLVDSVKFAEYKLSE